MYVCKHQEPVYSQTVALRTLHKISFSEKPNILLPCSNCLWYVHVSDMSTQSNTALQSDFVLKPLFALLLSPAENGNQVNTICGLANSQIKHGIFPEITIKDATNKIPDSAFVNFHLPQTVTFNLTLLPRLNFPSHWAWRMFQGGSS